MSIAGSNKLPNYPSSYRGGPLPGAPMSDRDKTVAWLHDMYRRNRKPRASLIEQADATMQHPDHVISDVVIACRPGGHSPELEDAKSKFMSDQRKGR